MRGPFSKVYRIRTTVFWAIFTSPAIYTNSVCSRLHDGGIRSPHQDCYGLTLAVSRGFGLRTYDVKKRVWALWRVELHFLNPKTLQAQSPKE